MVNWDWQVMKCLQKTEWEEGKMSDIIHQHI